MFASVWLLLSGLFYSLQLHSGSFPKPLTPEEERHYLERAAKATWRPETSWWNGICGWWPM